MSPAKEPDTQDLDNDNDLNEPSNEDDLISSDTGYVGHRRRGWLIAFVYMIIALLFALAVVFFGRWLYHRIHKSSTPAPTSQPAAAPATPSTPSNNSSNSSTQNTSNNSSNSSSSNSTPAQNSTTTPSNGQVPNTGPGNVVALFVGTAVLIGGLHYVYSLRRIS
jgi:cytoskeletal protein RodZ